MFYEKLPSRYRPTSGATKVAKRIPGTVRFSIMEQQDDKALEQLAVLEKEIAEIKSSLVMYDLIFRE